MLGKQQTVLKKILVYFRLMLASGGLPNRPKSKGHKQELTLWVPRSALLYTKIICYRFGLSLRLAKTFERLQPWCN